MIPPFEEMKEPKSYLLTLVKVFLFVSACLLTATLYLYFADKNKFAELSKRQKVAIIRSADNYREIPTKANIDSGITRTTVMPVSPDSLRYNSFIDTVTAAKDSSKSTQEIFSQQTLSINPPAEEKIKNDKNQKTAPLISPLQVDNVTVLNKKDVPEKGALANSNNQGAKADNILVTASFATDFLEKETSKASETDKLSGSFTVKNNGKEDAVSEVMVVVIQPDGQVMQTSNWENGIFYTANGKQIYSKKLRFNNGGGEFKKLKFSLQAERYLPGKYTIEIYHDGNMIGRSYKVLS